VETTPVKTTDPTTLPEPTPVITNVPEPVKPNVTPTPVKTTVPEPTPVKTNVTPTPVKTDPEPPPVKTTLPEPTPVKTTSPEPIPVKTTSPEPTSTPVTKNISKKWDPKGQSNEEKEEKTPVKTTAPEPIPESNIPFPEAGLTYEIGRGKEGGSENRMHIFSLQFKINGRVIINPSKDDIGIYCECPGTPPRFNIMISNNAYHIGFTPAEGGQHWFDFTHKGTFIDSDPLCLPIKNKFNKVPDHPYTGAARGGQKT